MASLNRRHWMRSTTVGVLGASVSGWFPTLAKVWAASPTKQRHCILLWMPGGPSQTDTFDMKPHHENGGEFKEISTSVSGLRISEHLPKLAGQAQHLAIVRSLSTKEGDHGRGTYLMRTGQRPMGPVAYPAMGASLAKQLGNSDTELPNYVSIGPFRAFNREAFGAGFLGPKYDPLVVAAADSGMASVTTDDRGFAELKVESLAPPITVDDKRRQRRLEMWRRMQADFLANHPGAPALRAHDTIYERTLDMMGDRASEAFDLSREDATLREAYGKGVFGQGCLLARRLIERGVSFIEVALTGSSGIGWDTHADNFNQLKSLSAELDAGWGTLLTDLDQRGLLEQTTVLWMGEFGRTPKINAQVGRDHFPQAWTCVFAGGGIAGGQAYGRTSDDGMEVVEKQVGVTDVLATLCAAVGVPPDDENYTQDGRPIPLVDKGSPIGELLA